MERQNWQKVKAIFDSVMQIETEERDSYLRNACSGDSELLREVESLLNSSDSADGFLEKPFAAGIGDLLADGSQDRLEPGQIFNRYRIIRKIGVGGMGEIYLAQDTHLNRLVAIKMLSGDATASPEQLHRFVQEAHAASALNHPNILTIYEIGRDGDAHFISTEFVDGETLSSRLARAPLDPLAAIDIAIDIASALAVAHKAGIVHRDIKPENIMLREDGYLKVLDFGLAKFSRDQNLITYPEKEAWQAVTSYLQRVMKVLGGPEDVEKAAAALDRSLFLDPKIIDARAYRTLIDRLQGETQKSREQISRLRRDAPNNFEVLYLSAAYYRFDGDYENAVACYDEMLRIDPMAKGAVHYSRARIFWYLGKFDEAFHEVEQAARLEPNHPFAKVFHAILTFRSGDPAGAAETLKGLFETYPSEGFRPYLSMCLSALGQHEAALNELTEETERVATVDPDVAYWLASAYLMAGKTELALTWLERAIRVGNHNLPWFESNPIWKPMFEDPRFKELMAGLRDLFSSDRSRSEQTTDVV